MNDIVEARHGAPSPDEDSAPYWEALTRHEIAVQQCTRCAMYRCPPLPACIECGSTGVRWSTASGAGVVYSWIEAHHAVGNLDADELPVVFVTVEFEYGCRIVARYVGAPRPAIGLPVRAAFVDHGGWTELVFQVPEVQA